MPESGISDSKVSAKRADAENRDGTADRLLKGMFLVSVAGFSMLLGFGRAFSVAKKREKIVEQTLVTSMEANSLALRALGWGSVIAVTGVGLTCYGLWKAIGGSNMEEFRQAAGKLLPKISNGGSGRTEFKNLTELFQYVIDEDNRAKAELNSSKNLHRSSAERTLVTDNDKTGPHDS